MALPTITVDRNRRHVLAEEVRARFDELEGRPTVEQRTPTGRVALAHVSELVIVYNADFEAGGWNWAVRVVRGCLTLVDGTVSSTERDIYDYRIPDRSWPAWLGETAALLHPGTFVSLIERPVVPDPSTLHVTEKMSPEQIDAEVGRMLAPAIGTIRALREAAGE